MKRVKVAETILQLDADYEVHPMAKPIAMLPPAVIRHLFGGGNVDLILGEARDITPTLLGVISLNIIVAKNLKVSYPPNLIDHSVWDNRLVNQAKKYLFTETGYEASIQSMNPIKFIYLRLDESDKSPLIKVSRYRPESKSDRGCLASGA